MWLVGRRVVSLAFRTFSTSSTTNFKVTVCGAGGGIGQPLSLLMQLNPMVSQLNVYDIVGTPGVAADLSHIDAASSTCGYVKSEQLKQALQCADIVIISAGLPRKPGMTRDDLFNKNAGIVKEIICSAAVSCPGALIAIITNPVNSVVPIAAEILKENNCYDPNRLFGVTTLDVVRARKFIGTIIDCDPKKVTIPVIGGHSGETIIPVLSQCEPKYCEEVEKLTKRIQDAGTEVVKAKAGAGSATLSMAYAAATFGNSLLKALCGECDVIECSYVQSCVTEASFFATPIRLGKNGMEENLGLPKLNDFEQKLLKKALPQLIGHIKKGVDFVKCGGGGK